MCIYNDHIPYTYLIGWSEHNKFYYGRRTAKDCHPDEFWVTYFTSSKEVKKFRKEHGEPDIIQIRKTFPDNPRACSLWEHKFLTKIKASYNPSFLNKTNGDCKWDRTGQVTVKDKDGNTFSVTKDDPRYLSGELVGVAAELITVKDTDGNTFSVSKDDQRYLSGELVSHMTGNTATLGYTNEYRKTNGYKTIPGKPKGSKEKEETKTKKSNTRKGKTTVRDKDGNCFLADVNDPKFISGEYVSVMAGVGKGRKLSQETKDKLKRPKTKEHIEKYRLTTKNRPTFYCECCDVTIKGVPQWNKHMNSKKHMDKTTK